MISADTNIFVQAADQSMLHYEAANSFVQSHFRNRQFLLSELVLVELYMALRNPAIFNKPLSGKDAVAYCDQLKTAGRWQIVDLVSTISEDLWRLAAKPDFGFRRIIDARLGLSLVAQGVTDFATANVKHFGDCGFKRVWNPLRSIDVVTGGQSHSHDGNSSLD